MSSSALERALRAVDAGDVIPDADLTESLRAVMSGNAPAEQVRPLLIGLHQRGESVSELVAGARVLREFMTRVPITNRPVIDTCGTGGTGAGLFNVSTASAIVAAACGTRVAKHGNRKVTGSTGSADVLQELGVAIDAPLDLVGQCVDRIGIGFCFAPQAHPAVRHVAEVRKSIPHPTLFNWLGPLCNPALAEHQVLGVGKANLLEKFPAALEQLGVARFAVLHSADGLCELSTADISQVIVRRDGQTKSLVWQPEDFGVERGSIQSAVVDSPKASAELIHRVFAGEKGTARDLVVLNAAAAIWLGDSQLSLHEAADRVRSCLDRGDAAKKLKELAAGSRGEFGAVV